MIRKTNKNENIYFSYQISNKAYATKPERNGYNYGARNFSWTHTNINDFVKCIEKGYIIAPSERNLESALKSPVQIVCYDIEHTPVPMEEYVNNLSIKPTVYYNSFSHGTTPNDNRFRLVYVFDEPFSGSDYQSIYNAISDENGMGKELDRLIVNQCYNGTNKEVYSTGIVYEVPDICATPNSNHLTHTITNANCATETSVLSDFKKLGFSTFIEKYDAEFGMAIPTHTDFIDSGDERYSVCPEEYYEIPRKTRWSKQLKQTQTFRWVDGENRHKKIYVAGIVWRHLIPTVTADEMLYLLTREIYNYYEMKDGKFSKSYIIKLTEAVMKADLETALKDIKHSSFKVDETYCYQNRIDKRSVVCQINNDNRTKAKEYKYRIIDSLYRQDLSEANNIQLLNDYGIEVSPSFLKRYKKERGFSKQREKKFAPNSNHLTHTITNGNELFSDNETVTDEKILECYDFGLSEWDNYKEISKWCNITYNELCSTVQPYVLTDDKFRMDNTPNFEWWEETYTDIRIKPNTNFGNVVKSDTPSEEQPEEKKEPLFNAPIYYNPYEYEAEQQRLEDFKDNVMNTFNNKDYVRDAMEDVLATLNVITGGNLYDNE